MGDLIWEDPPAAVVNRQRKTLYSAVAEQLRSRPGVWAKLPGERTKGTAAGLAQNIRRGAMKDFPKGQFEAVHDDTQVYVRFVGEVDDEVGAVEQIDAPVIRQWAREQGMQVAERGRLAPEVITAYDEAHAR